MDDYLKGFVDGYNKANQKQETKVAITIDGKVVAQEIYKDIGQLINRDILRSEGNRI
ncbi:hypothetical protein [Sporosarcina globispora]|uniref:hypothetical protein n=1 Tax=Sporosarcina globispora TaxID=1459 RepID=UPI000A7B3993|nr:hypothetical protein [Sporosarcina globispora]